jgi:hypothetical protein
MVRPYARYMLAFTTGWALLLTNWPGRYMTRAGNKKTARADGLGGCDVFGQFVGTNLPGGVDATTSN